MSDRPVVHSHSSHRRKHLHSITDLPNRMNEEDVGIFTAPRLEGWSSFFCLREAPWRKLIAPRVLGVDQFAQRNLPTLMES